MTNYQSIKTTNPNLYEEHIESIRQKKLECYGIGFKTADIEDIYLYWVSDFNTDSQNKAFKVSRFYWDGGFSSDMRQTIHVIFKLKPDALDTTNLKRFGYMVVYEWIDVQSDYDEDEGDLYSETIRYHVNCTTSDKFRDITVLFDDLHSKNLN